MVFAGNDPPPCPTASATLYALERRPAKRLLAFELLDRASPRGRRTSGCVTHSAPVLAPVQREAEAA